MPHKITSVSPGKIILTGEHSVVYDKPALLAAIDREVRVEIEEAEKDKVLIEASKVGLKKSFVITELAEYWRQASQAWEDYSKNGKDKTWRAFSKDPAMVVKASAGLFYAQMDKNGGVKMVITSAIPVGSGMGSSASVSSAILGGLAEYFSLGWSKDKVYEETYQIEQIAHGKASGADPAAVIYGGCLEFQKTGDVKHIQPYRLPEYKGAICLIDSGKPAETTGEMVAMVNSQFSSANSPIKEIIEQIGRLSEKVIKQVKNGRMRWEWVPENERWLEELEVVGNKAKLIINSLKKENICAKVCGAGGVKTGSGMVLAYHEEPDRLQYAVGQLGLSCYQVRLGADGWRIK
ncbi:hypothetical protein A3B57_04250 [Microgenomates group bacterium RIFCSPLOWO2_01_FULL_47_10]|nr:MAG: hypothetical protein A3B57_04250 [Microgenomates group bacterium RIFCSPLOWO2_01_FULL_47_10]